MPSRRTLLVLLLRSTHGFFEASRESAGGVIEVDAESWAATVVASEKPAFVMWYSPTRGTASGAVAMTRSGESTPHLTPIAAPPQVPPLPPLRSELRGKRRGPRGPALC